MQKVFRAFVRKEFYHILRDKRTLLILFGMPLAQILIFGYAVTNEFKDAKIDILDYSRDELSEKLISHLQSSGNFILNKIHESDRDIDKDLKSGESKMVLVIPRDFAKTLGAGKGTSIQIITDGSDPNNANTLLQYATEMIRTFQAQYVSKADPAFQIQVETRMIYNPQLQSAHNFIPGTIALILLIICAMLTSLTIAREKELGTMEILLVSPLQPLLIILGKVTPYAILSFLNAIMVLLIGFFVFNVPINGSLILLLSMCFLYVLTALSLGTLISTVSNTQQDAMLRSLMGLMMPSMMLSGFIFPLASMPVILQYLGQVIPATYFIEILKGVMLRGVGIDNILKEVAVLALMTGVLLVLAWKKFSIRLE